MTKLSCNDISLLLNQLLIVEFLTIDKRIRKYDVGKKEIKRKIDAYTANTN